MASQSSGIIEKVKKLEAKILDLQIELGQKAVREAELTKELDKVKTEQEATLSKLLILRTDRFDSLVTIDMLRSENDRLRSRDKAFEDACQGLINNFDDLKPKNARSSFEFGNLPTPATSSGAPLFSSGPFGAQKPTDASVNSNPSATGSGGSLFDRIAASSSGQFGAKESMYGSGSFGAEEPTYGSGLSGAKNPFEDSGARIVASRFPRQASAQPPTDASTSQNPNTFWTQPSGNSTPNPISEKTRTHYENPFLPTQTMNPPAPVRGETTTEPVLKRQRLQDHDTESQASTHKAKVPTAHSPRRNARQGNTRRTSAPYSVKGDDLSQAQKFHVQENQEVNWPPKAHAPRSTGAASGHDDWRSKESPKPNVGADKANVSGKYKKVSIEEVNDD